MQSLPVSIKNNKILHKSIKIFQGGIKMNEIITKRTVLSVAAGIGIGIVFANFVR